MTNRKDGGAAFPRNYTFSDDQLRQLGGWTVLPHDARLELMNEFFKGKDPAYIALMFSNFIDMAHTVIENCGEQAWMCAVAEWGAEPSEAEKLNMPSLLGAVNGYKIAQGVMPDNLCHGCAFRKGSVANTCLITVSDTTYCYENDQTFMCHEDLTLAGEPTRKCRGFLKSKIAEREKAGSHD